ncbi:MAG: hypothetical protein A3J55_00210 [Candidatus Ryanbacteria bacterium RIFCSPHIGHO2_02_FULL_45_17b]|uniref:Peptidase S11 D-alanyl-D-alanine carboxypeptidase A N-terminal domain-containing protein n=1 Tax=Candidatus Ryanbacteria bacterium RIFCSPHIGHO2_01_FULL_45_22 TaxID=1802114 RepID=A0A1G2G168_9BACT|nr:MAG: hypothetical protein A2719_02675 [Candidatus Ryanbacteria bacterium RIFCSPHIGHO2_01_FULL_45_22]OGZ46971.1 MAG: hypothetical protein A3J55_00210 [Candidatus Ryanbacteria bacterium RIFCSPHIGHO2_02_FULL_45_17b]
MGSSFRFIVVCCALTGGVLFLALPIKPSRTNLNEATSYATLLNATDTSTRDASKTGSSSPPHITAKAAVIYDPLQNEFLFQKNADDPSGIASITKIMTAIVALERVGENDIIEVHTSAIETEGDEGALLDGEHFTLHNLIILMLTASSNDAAVAIAEHVGFLQGASSFEESQRIFVRLMNETAKNRNLKDTQFQNPTGLDIDETAGIVSNVSTARETAQLIGYALRYPLLYTMSPTLSTLLSEEGNVHILSPTHVLLMNESGVISGKTGFTDIAGGTLATVAEIPVGKLSIVVILGSTRNDRFQDTLHLLDWLRTQ